MPMARTEACSPTTNRRSPITDHRRDHAMGMVPASITISLPVMLAASGEAKSPPPGKNTQIVRG